MNRVLITDSATIPIVFNVTDPVGQGLAHSLNRPGGNATGVNVLAAELGPKRFELLRDLVPKAVLAGTCQPEIINGLPCH